MLDTAHISTKHDGSLSGRIDEYLSAYQAYQNVQSSLKHADDDNWSDTLGERADIEQAKDIIKRGLSKATSAIESSELSVAVESGLMSQEQCDEFTKVKQRQEFEQRLKKSHQAQSNGFQDEQ